MTYTELSRLRGIGRESAVKLAQRKQWRRIPGNDGEARVCVPPDWLEPAKERSGEHSPLPSPDGGVAAAFERALQAAVTPLHEAVTSLTARAEAAEVRADHAETDARQARAERLELEGRAFRLEAKLSVTEDAAVELQGRVDDLQGRLYDAQSELAAVAEQAEELGRQLKAERAGGRWARLRRAWRGI